MLWGMKLDKINLALMATYIAADLAEDHLKRRKQKRLEAALARHTELDDDDDDMPWDDV